MSDKILSEAKRLHALGFGVLRLHKKSKRPIDMGWTSGARADWITFQSQYQPGENIGVRLGEPSKIGENYLTCIDVDIKDPAFKEAALACLEGLTGKKRRFPTVQSGAGNGSRHVYCVSSEPFKMITVAKEKGWEVCIYSAGRQMVLPPSIHPDSGKEYKWAVPVTSVADLPVMDFSQIKSVKATKEKKVKDGATKNQPASQFKFHPQDVELAWLPISDDVRKAIDTGEGVSDRSGYLLLAGTALHSAGLNQDEVLSVLTDKTTYLGQCAFDHAQTQDRFRAAEWVFKYTYVKIKAERSAEGVFSGLPIVAERELDFDEIEEFEKELLGDNWRTKLVRTAKGYVNPSSLKNLDLIFTHAVEGAVFKKDLFANRIAYGVDTPWGGENGKYLEDIDMVLVKRWLADTDFGIEPSTNAIVEATSLVAHRLAVHPVRDWLRSLKWDGKPRINTWLKDYCNAVAAEPYLSEVSRKFLLAMVKRVFEPGCQWDYVLVLEGKQGQYKSSIARALASDKWFMDNLPDLKDKDAMLNLQGKWVIELGELQNVKRADYNLTKAYLVRRTDTVRPHYGRLMADVPRQSVFIGTVNEGQYLKDPTGNRRFWPVKVGECDVKGLTEVRDQLFAEAYHVYVTTNEVLMLSSDANAQAAEAQEERKVEDDASEMKEALLKFMRSEAGEKALAAKVDDDVFSFRDFRSRELMENSNMPWFRWGMHRYGPQLASEVLQEMGFKRGRHKARRFWYLSEGEKGIYENDSQKVTTRPPTRVCHRSVTSKNEDFDFN